jgi:hypothetical protein
LSDIVASRLADEHMWAEVLSLGGFDLIAAPFELEDVLRVSMTACRIAAPARATAAVEPVVPRQVIRLVPRILSLMS